MFLSDAFLSNLIYPNLKKEDSISHAIAFIKNIYRYQQHRHFDSKLTKF